MDSLSQFVLGSAVAVVVTKEPSRKVAIWGGIIATIPDLDVFIQYADPIERTTSHRGFSHSLIVLTLFAPFLGALISKVLKTIDKQKVILMTWLALITHPLLDSLTIYGTQLLWPIADLQSNVMIGSIFIIDPLYTLWLLIAFLLILLGYKNKNVRLRVAQLGLAISTLYLSFTLYAQERIVKPIIKDSSFDQVIITPYPFNTINWNIVKIKGDEYTESCVNIFDQIEIEKFRGFLNHDLLNSDSISRYAKFSNNFYKLDPDTFNNRLLLTDIRMGNHQQYVFNFIVGSKNLDEKNYKSIKPFRVNVGRGRTLEKISLACKG